MYKYLFIFAISTPFVAFADTSDIYDQTIDEIIPKEDIVDQKIPVKKEVDTAERFVMPVSKWLEDKAHRSKVLNPVASQSSARNKKSQATGLRQALVEAQKVFPGTVLSARKDINEDESVYFVVKILSQDGVIEEVYISSKQETLLP